MKTYKTIALLDEPKTDSPALDVAKQIYCINWPMVMTYLTSLTARIKNIRLRWLANQGLAIFDALHQQTCRQK